MRIAAAAAAAATPYRIHAHDEMSNCGRWRMRLGLSRLVRHPLDEDDADHDDEDGSGVCVQQI